jgi:hypothetical protein
MHGPVWLEGLKNERGDPQPEKPKNVKTPRFIYLLIYLLFQEAGALLSKQSRILSELNDAPYLSYASPCLRCAAPYRATPHPSELRHTLPSYATPFQATPHFFRATPHPSELRHTLPSYATPFRVTPHPSKQRHISSELRHPFRATPHPSELRHNQEKCAILLFAIDYFVHDVKFVWIIFYALESYL